MSKMHCWCNQPISRPSGVAASCSCSSLGRSRDGWRLARLRSNWLGSSIATALETISPSPSTSQTSSGSSSRSASASPVTGPFSGVAPCARASFWPACGSGWAVIAIRPSFRHVALRSTTAGRPSAGSSDSNLRSFSCAAEMSISSIPELRNGSRTCSALPRRISAISQLPRAVPTRVSMSAARERFGEPHSSKPWSPQTAPMSLACTNVGGSKRCRWTSQSAAPSTPVSDRPSTLVPVRSRCAGAEVACA